MCYSDASEVKCPRVGSGKSHRLIYIIQKTLTNRYIEDVSLQHDTYAYWTHIEEYPMHLRAADTRLVLPKARACFWSAITFLSDGTPGFGDLASPTYVH